jgi:hypothetical protein
MCWRTLCWRTRDLKDDDAAFNVLGRDCSWRACALAVSVPPTSRRSISRPQASRANILPYGSGATLGTRQGTAHLLLEVSLPQRFCPTCLGFLVGRGFRNSNASPTSARYASEHRRHCPAPVATTTSAVASRLHGSNAVGYWMPPRRTLLDVAPGEKRRR